MPFRLSDGRAFDATVIDGQVAVLKAIPLDPHLPWLLPTFCDLQVNGARGIGFTSDALTIDQVNAVSGWVRRHGTGPFLPTVITASFVTIRQAFATLARFADVPGFHLEGPYLSPLDGPRGAHPREHIRDPDLAEFDRWQEAAGGRIRMVTLAPERPGAIAFIEQLVRRGVVVALGHTMATREQLHDAVSAGATVSTHLGNGIAATLPRHDNPIWHQLADDRLTATLIADGHHLPAEIFKVITAAKSTDKVILISDAGTLAGQPAGRYRDWGQEFDVLADGKIVVPGTPYLAGAGHGLDHAVRWLRANRLADESAIERMACVNPRRMLGLPVPELRIGAVWSDFQFVS